MKKRFLSSFLALALCLTLLPTAAMAEGGSGSTPTEIKIEGTTLKKDSSEWIESDGVLELGEGSYKLTSDVTIGNTILVTGTVTLDLNGYVLKYENSDTKGSVIKIDDSDTHLTLKDSNPSVKHYFSVSTDTDTAGLWIYQGTTNNNGSYNEVTGGVITGGTGTSSGSDTHGGGVYVKTGSFTMESGNIVGCTATKGGGVYVGAAAGDTAEGTFTMNGGSIVGCTAEVTSYDGEGGGVYVHADKKDDGEAKGTFTMNGGSIKNCTASGQGGGVYVNSHMWDSGVSVCGGEFTMSGGEISGNQAGEKGGGVELSFGVVFTVGGDPSKTVTISGNTLSNGGSTVVDNVYLDKYSSAVAKITVADGGLTSGSDIKVTDPATGARNLTYSGNLTLSSDTTLENQYIGTLTPSSQNITITVKGQVVVGQISGDNGDNYAPLTIKGEGTNVPELKVGSISCTNCSGHLTFERVNVTTSNISWSSFTGSAPNAIKVKDCVLKVENAKSNPENHSLYAGQFILEGSNTKIQLTNTPISSEFQDSIQELIDYYMASTTDYTAKKIDGTDSSFYLYQGDAHAISPTFTQIAETAQIPWTTTVQQGGNATPPTGKTFKLEVAEATERNFAKAITTGTDNALDGVKATGEVTTNGDTTYDDELSLNGTKKSIHDLFDDGNGILVRQKQDDTDSDWTLDETVYYISKNPISATGGDAAVTHALTAAMLLADTAPVESVPGATGYYIYKAVPRPDDITYYDPPEWSLDLKALDEMSFVNKYTKNGTTGPTDPSGGDGGDDDGAVDYLIRATAGTGGAIAPAGSVRVSEGASKTYTITPDSGRAVLKVLVDGKNVGAVTTYTFKNVRADHTIEAVFTASGSNIPADLNSTDHVAYVQGFADGLIRPNANITRAQTAVMLYRLLTMERRSEIETNVHSFTDIPAGAWYETAVATMTNGGYITGFSDGTFRGDAPITRAQFVAILVRFLGVRDVDCDFSDVPASHWAYDYIATAVDAGWISGYSDGSFRPDQNITRAQVMAIINRALNRGVDANSALLNFQNFPDNPETAWHYYEVIEAANGHDYTGSRPSEDWTRLK